MCWFWLVIGIVNTHTQYWQSSQITSHSEVLAVQVNVLDIVLWRHSAFASLQLRQDWAVQLILDTPGRPGKFEPPVVQISLGDCWQNTLCRRSDRKREIARNWATNHLHQIATGNIVMWLMWRTVHYKVSLVCLSKCCIYASYYTSFCAIEENTSIVWVWDCICRS